MSLNHLAPPWEADISAGYGKDGDHGIRVYAAARECQPSQLVGEVYGYANARLMVAAPDLLAAAEAVAASFSSQVASVSRGTIDALRAAIVKAKGEQPQTCSECGRERPDLLDGKCRPCWSRLLDKPEVSA